MRGSEIRHRKLYHDVVDHLLKLIRDGTYPPGSLLPSERALTESCGTGRQAIREALQSLQRMGVVSIHHGEGTRVQTLTAGSVIGQIAEIAHFLICSTPDVLEHLKQSRLHFECALVRQAATLATGADIEGLRVALDVHANADATNDRNRHAAFHVAIATISRNPIYIGLCEVMFDLLARFYMHRKVTTAFRRSTLVEHRRIFERIAARDAEGAANAMQAHLRHAQLLYSHRAERRKR